MPASNYINDINHIALLTGTGTALELMARQWVDGLADNTMPENIYTLTHAHLGLMESFSHITDTEQQILALVIARTKGILLMSEEWLNLTKKNTSDLPESVLILLRANNAALKAVENKLTEM